MAMLRVWLRWATGWTLIALFYAHTLVGGNTTEITPIASAVLAAFMAVTALIEFFRPPVPSAPTEFRRVALFLFVASISLWVVISTTHYFARPPTVRDIGQFGIYCLIPVLLLLNRERSQLVTLVARLCVIMSVADLAYNLLTLAGFVTPVTSGGGLVVSGIRFQRYAGISGNVLAAGQVALIGVLYSAWRTRCDPKSIPRIAWFLIFALCFLGLHLVVARRYEVAAVIGATIILIPWARRVPLPIYAFIQGAFGLYIAFVSLEPEEILRSRLISAGFEDVLSVFWLGRGVYFAAPVTTTKFLDMWAGGVTESGVLDLALAFGAPATALFLSAIAFALLAKRASVNWIPVLVTVLAGTLPYNNPLSFLGSVVFFGALLTMILQELPERNVRQNVRATFRGPVMMPG